MAVRIALTFFFFVILATRALADRALIAVATNFADTAQALADAYESEDQGKIDFVFGSTGKLYAQILRGAPFDAFLAADRERPRLIAEQGLGETPFTFAQGILVWWPDKASENEDEKIAVANPELAPYGRAALEVLGASGSASSYETRLVFGENVGQAFAMVETGNAGHGLVARSSVLSFTKGEASGIEASGYSPISQDAILLVKGQTNPVARRFLEFLKSPQAFGIIEKSGYRIPGHD